jgi:hypothetical protein
LLRLSSRTNSQCTPTRSGKSAARCFNMGSVNEGWVKECLTTSTFYSHCVVNVGPSSPLELRTSNDGAASFELVLFLLSILDLSGTGVCSISPHVGLSSPLEQSVVRVSILLSAPIYRSPGFPLCIPLVGCITILAK